jgi:hypothetical protein
VAALRYVSCYALGPPTDTAGLFVNWLVPSAWDAAWLAHNSHVHPTAIPVPCSPARKEAVNALALLSAEKPRVGGALLFRDEEVRSPANSHRAVVPVCPPTCARSGATLRQKANAPAVDNGPKFCSGAASFDAVVQLVHPSPPPPPPSTPLTSLLQGGAARHQAAHPGANAGKPRPVPRLITAGRPMTATGGLTDGPAAMIGDAATAAPNFENADGALSAAVGDAASSSGEAALAATGQGGKPAKMKPSAKAAAAAGEGGPAYCRKDKSLGLLCEK